MKKILSIIAVLCLVSNAFAGAASDIQRNTDTRYKDMLRQQEIDNRTKFIKNGLPFSEDEQISGQSQTRREFKEVTVKYNFSLSRGRSN